MSISGVLEVVFKVAQALESCGVDYFVGGSVASSIQGYARSTQDVDIVVRLPPEKVGALVASLGPDFLVDDVALKDAMARRKSWNIFFAPTMLRVDLFAVGGDAYDAEELNRRQAVELLPGRPVFVKSPEDTVLRKLLWFRLGGEQSGQQFRDVTEVLRVQGPRLDAAYLDRWANTLGVVDLLARARAAAG